MAGTFHEVLFPVDVSRGSSGGAQFKTSIVSIDSGFEHRRPTWDKVKCKYNAIFGIKDTTQMAELRNFFMARQGRAFGFRYKDWADYLIEDQIIATGDGTKTVFQVYKNYVSGNSITGQSWTFRRLISKLAWGTVSGVTVGGAALEEVTGAWTGTDNQYQVDYNLGQLSFRFAPTGDIVIGSAEFHVPVRFDTDSLTVTHDFWTYSSVNTIPMVEVRDFLFVAPSQILDVDYGDFDEGAMAVYTIISDYGDFDLGTDYTQSFDYGDFSSRL